APRFFRVADFTLIASIRRACFFACTTTRSDCSRSFAVAGEPSFTNSVSGVRANFSDPLFVLTVSSCALTALTTPRTSWPPSCAPTGPARTPSRLMMMRVFTIRWLLPLQELLVFLHLAPLFLTLRFDLLLFEPLL